MPRVLLRVNQHGKFQAYDLEGQPLTRLRTLPGFSPVWTDSEPRNLGGDYEHRFGIWWHLEGTAQRILEAAGYEVVQDPVAGEGMG